MRHTAATALAGPQRSRRLTAAVVAITLLAPLMVLAEGAARPEPVHAADYPATPFDFAGAPFPGRSSLYSPASGNRTPTVLTVYLRYSDRGYGRFDESWLANRMYGPHGSIAAWYRSNSFGRTDLHPARETGGMVDNGVVMVDIGPEGFAEHPDTNPGWRRFALEQADPFVDYSAFDTNGDGNISRTELLVVAVLGTGRQGGQAGEMSREGSKLDGVSFRPEFESWGGFRGLVRADSGVSGRLAAMYPTAGRRM
jgi:hypothetical protein